MNNNCLLYSIFKFFSAMVSISSRQRRDVPLWLNLFCQAKRAMIEIYLIFCFIGGCANNHGEDQQIVMSIPTADSGREFLQLKQHQADVTRDVFAIYKFPSRIDAVRVCGQNMYYDSGEYSRWDVFACFASLAEVMEYYNKTLGERGFNRLENGGNWSFRKDYPTSKDASGNVDGRSIKRTLEIISSGKHTLPKICIFPPQTQSIIMMSLEAGKMNSFRRKDYGK